LLVCKCYLRPRGYTDQHGVRWDFLGARAGWSQTGRDPGGRDPQPRR